MTRALFLLFSLTLFSCAAATRFTINPTSKGWMQIVTIPPAETPSAKQPLLFLRNSGTGAEIMADAYDYGDKTVLQMAEGVRDKLQAAYVVCGKIENDGRVVSFRTTLVHESGAIWGGKIAVLHVKGSPATTIFIVAGRWPAEYDEELIAEFDSIIFSASVK